MKKAPFYLWYMNLVLPHVNPDPQFLYLFGRKWTLILLFSCCILNSFREPIGKLISKLVII